MCVCVCVCVCRPSHLCAARLQSHALDDKTTSILGKLIMSGELSRMDGCISQGKEACVFRALGAK